MKYLVTCLFILVTLGASAQRDATRYITELRNYKHQYMVRELSLSRNQAREFFDIYDAMEDSLKAFNDSVRAVEAEALALPDPTPEQLDAANEVIYNQSFREAEIERNAYTRLADILTPRQMLKLKSTERSFNQTLMRQHRRSRTRQHQDNPTM